MSYDLVTVNAERHTVLPCSATGLDREGKYAVQMHKSGNLPFMGTETACGFRSRGIDRTVTGSVKAGSVCGAFCFGRKHFLQTGIPFSYRKDDFSMKKTLQLLLCLGVAAMLTGCSTETDTSSDSVPAETITAEPETTAPTEPETEAPTEPETSAPEADDAENYNTGDAALDNVRNQDEIGEKEILVISFGTSFNDSRRLTIGAIENAIETAFPDYAVRRGFTSNIIIDHVQQRDGILIDDVAAALDRAVDNGVKTLIVQPTHLMDGLEYHDLTAEVAQYADAFEHVAIGEPLLSSEEDFQRVTTAITDWTADYDDGETAIVFMGHGTEADSNGVYAKMQEMLTDAGKTNYFVGTVEAEPALEDVLAAVKAGDYKRVVLEPLMVVAGDHANNDMAGDEADSWKTVFANEGIRTLYTEHTQAAIDSLQ